MEKAEVVKLLQDYIREIKVLETSEDHHDGEDFFMDYGLYNGNRFATAIEYCIKHL